MNETETFSADAAHAAVEAAYFGALANRARGLPIAAPDELPTRVRAARERLWPRVAHLVCNDLDRANVGFVLLAAAGFEALAPDLSAPQAMQVIDECLNGPLHDWVARGTRHMLDEAPDAFAALVETSKKREAEFFGPSFTFEHPIDDGFGYVLHVKRCLFHEALKACGHPELQPVLCRFDLGWIDAIDERRHRLRFTRPSTFASADLCRMWFARLEHLEGPVGAQDG